MCTCWAVSLHYSPQMMRKLHHTAMLIYEVWTAHWSYRYKQSKLHCWYKVHIAHPITQKCWCKLHMEYITLHASHQLLCRAFYVNWCGNVCVCVCARLYACVCMRIVHSRQCALPQVGTNCSQLTLQLTHTSSSPRVKNWVKYKYKYQIQIETPVQIQADLSLEICSFS